MTARRPSAASTLQCRTAARQPSPSNAGMGTKLLEPEAPGSLVASERGVHIEIVDAPGVAPEGTDARVRSITAWSLLSISVPERGKRSCPDRQICFEYACCRHAAWASCRQGCDSDAMAFAWVERVDSLFYESATYRPTVIHMQHALRDPAATQASLKQRCFVVLGPSSGPS